MPDNKNHNQSFCRIEIASCYKIFLSGFKKDICFLFQDYDICARDFDDFESTILCIYELEKAYYSERSEETDNTVNSNECVSLVIYNQWEDILDLEMYLDKWRLGGISGYTYEWRDNITKNKDLDKDSKYFAVHIPCLHEVSEDEFISKKRVIQLLRKWLKTGDRSADFDREQRLAYMQETWG